MGSGNVLVGADGMWQAEKVFIKGIEVRLYIWGMWLRMLQKSRLQRRVLPVMLLEKVNEIQGIFSIEGTVFEIPEGSQISCFMVEHKIVWRMILQFRYPAACYNHEECRWDHPQ